ncbi:MAG: hypothetical protein WDZ90_01870 [Candidatus Paceibacterota bacterium]
MDDDKTNMTPSNTPSPDPSGESRKKEGHIGPLISAGIIILILVVGGIYYWGTKVNEDGLQNETEQDMDETSIEALQTQDSSDEVGAIEEDLENTNLDSLDAELSDIESELGF